MIFPMLVVTGVMADTNLLCKKERKRKTPALFVTATPGYSTIAPEKEGSMNSTTLEDYFSSPACVLSLLERWCHDPLL